MPEFESSSVVAWAAIVVLRVGQTLLIVGSVRSKNAAASAMRLLIDFAVVTLALWAIGAAFVPPFGSSDFITFSHLFGIDPQSQVAFGLLPMLIIATGAVHGAVAERSRIAPVLIVSGLLAAIVVPVINSLSVSVTLSDQIPFRIVDNGVGLAAVIGGAVALVAALLVGPRKGKFNRDLSCNFVPGHNVSFQLFGVMVLAIAFSVAGSGAAILGASAALLAGALFGRLRFGKVDTGLTIGSTLAGLIAASAAGGPTWGAVLIGLIAGAIAPWVVIFVETRLRIDDVTGSITSHLLGGMLGLIAAALLRGGAPFGQRLGSLGANLALAFVSAGVVTAVAWGVFSVCRKRGTVRMTEGAEFDGADLSELDLNAYPDFQQTTIKSYHLREL